MKYLKYTVFMIAACCSGLMADPVPRMPELEAFIAKGEFVTEADIKAAGAELEQRLMIDSYFTRYGLSEDEVRTRFADVLSFVGYLGGGKFDRELYDEFKARQSLDNEDLFLRHNALFRVLNDDPKNAEMIEAMRTNIIEMVEDGGYSMIRICGAAYDYRKRANALDDSTLDDERFLFEQFANLLSTLEMDTASRRYIWDKFIDPYIDTKSTPLRDLMLEVVADHDGVDPWFVHMIRGVDQERVAWIRRGSGYINTVNSEQINAFHSHLDASIAELRAAYEIDPMCPQTSSFMVEAVYPRGSMWEDEGWTWFGRTLIACIDYDPVYKNIRHILQDKWYGGMTSRAEFAQWCAREDLAGTGVGIQGLYTLERSWWTYGVDYGDADWFWESETDAIEAVMKSLQIRIDKGLDPDLDYEHSILAFMEYRHNGDYAKSAAHIRACEKGISPNARRKMRFDDLNLASIVLPLSVPETADIARQALSDEGAQEFEIAMQQWQRVMKILDEQGDELAFNAVRNRAQGTRWQSAYNERSGWVALSFDEHLSGWDPHEGNWERIDEHTIRATKRGSENEVLLVADLDTGYWYEIRAKARLINEKEKYTTMGINYCRGNRKTDGWDQMRYLSARLGRERAALGWHYAGNDYDIAIPEAGEDGWFEYRLLIKGDQVEGYINAQLVGKGEHPNWKPEKEPDLIRVAIGGHLVKDEIIEFSNIQIRKRRPAEDIEF